MAISLAVLSKRASLYVSQKFSSFLSSLALQSKIGLDSIHRCIPRSFVIFLFFLPRVIHFYLSFFVWLENWLWSACWSLEAKKRTRNHDNNVRVVEETNGCGWNSFLQQVSPVFGSCHRRLSLTESIHVLYTWISECLHIAWIVYIYVQEVRAGHVV